MVVGMGGGNSIEVEVEAEGTRGFQRDMQSAEQSLSSLRETAFAAGAALTGIGVAGAAGIGAASQQAAELETAFAEVSTLMGEGQSAASQYGDTVADLSTEFAAQGGQVEVTNALYQTLSAGIADAGDETAFLETSLKAATAGLTETQTAVDALSTVVNAYSLDASESARVSDVLFETVRQGKTRFGELSDTIGRVVPTAAEMGVEIEQVSAAIATLTAQGQSTDQAVTSVNRALTSLLKPTAEANEVLERMGFESGRALVQAEGFAGALELLEEHTSETDDSMTDVFGNVRAMRAVLPLAGDASESFAENLDAMENSAGATDEAFQKMSDTAQFQVRQILNELKVAVSTLGDAFLSELAPVLESVASVIGDLTDWIQGLDESTRSLIARVGVVGTAFSLLAGAGTLAVATFSAVSGAILPVVAVLGTVAAAAGALWAAWQTNFGNIRGVARDTFGALRGLWATHGEPLQQDIQGVLDQLRAAWTQWGDEIQSVAEALLTYLSNTLVNGVDVALTGIRVVLDLLQGDFQGAFSTIEGFLDRWVGRVQNVLDALGLSGLFGGGGGQAILNSLRGVFNTITAIVNENVLPVFEKFAGLFTDIVSTVQNNSDMIQSAFSEAVSTFSEVWNTHAAPLVDEAIQTFNALLNNVIRPIVSLISAVITGTLRNIRRFWDRWGDEILTILMSSFEVVANIVGQVLDQILTTVRVTMALVRGDWGEAWEMMKGLVERTVGRIIDVIDPLWKILKNFIGLNIEFGMALTGGAVDAVKSILNTLQKIVGKTWESLVEITTEVLGLEQVEGENREFSPEAETGFVDPRGTPGLKQAFELGQDLGEGLAEGGIVTAPTAALVGEGGESEAVLPLSKLNTVLDAGGRGATVVVENMDLSGRDDPKKAGRDAARALNDELSSANLEDTHL